MSKSSRLLWMDMEMTGLDPKRERVIEIATLVTDAELNIIAEGPEFVIHQPDEILDAMDAWNKSHHGASGLIEQVKNSTISESEAENRTLDFIKEHCPAKKIPLAGNSVHQDRLFVQTYMPKIDDYLHYRNVDVSTIKELTRRWFPTISAQTPEKQNTHRALDDIRESIAELRYYREHVFVKLHK